LEKLEFLWVGDWKSEQSLTLGENRSFSFGDGFFESMRFFSDGTNVLWPFHWDRLSRTITALKYPWPNDLTQDRFLALIQSRFPKNWTTDIRVKIVFFRIGEGRYTPENTRLAFFLSIEPCLQPWIQSISKISVSESVFLFRNPFSWIKTTSALVYVMANLERHERGMDDLILSNESGFAVEGCYSSISWKSDGCLYFPTRTLGGFDSCHRRYLEKYWNDRGLEFKEVSLKTEKVLDADWICFGGATGIRVWKKPEVPFPVAEFGLYPPIKSEI